MVKRDSSLAVDYERVLFLKEKKWSRDAYIYNFERDEIWNGFCERGTVFSAWLFSLGYPVSDPEAIPYIIKNIKSISGALEPESEFKRSPATNSLAYISLPEIEDDIVKFIPEPYSTSDIVKSIGAESMIKTLRPILSTVKSKKAIPKLSAIIYSLMQQAEGEGDDAVRAKKNLSSELCIDIIMTFAGIQDVSAKPALNKLFACNTSISNTILYALVEIGDRKSLSLIKTIAEKTFGDVEQTIFIKTLFEYAKDCFGHSDIDLTIAKKALTTILPKNENPDLLHMMALSIVANHEEKSEAKKIIIPLLSSPFTSVRRLTKKLLERLGDRKEMMYADRAYIDFVYKHEGKKKLLQELSNPYAVFKHSIIRKLVDEKDTQGTSKFVIEYLNSFMEFATTTGSYYNNEWYTINYAIYAAAAMKNKEIDDALVMLYKHPNIIFRTNSVFAHWNYPYSPYLKKVIEGIDLQKIDEEKAVCEMVNGSITLTVEDFDTKGEVKCWTLGVPVYGVDFSPDGRKVVVAGSSRTILCNNEGKELFVLQEGGWAYDAMFAADGKSVAVGFQAGHINVYDADTGKLLKQFKHGGVPHGVRKVKFSPSGKLLATVSDEGTLCVWNPKNGKVLQTFDMKDDANTLDWFLDEKKIVVGTDSNLVLIDIIQGKIVKKIDSAGLAEVCVFLSKGKVKIAAGGNGKTICIFDEKLTLLNEYKQSKVARIRVTKDETFLYAGSYDGKDIGVWQWDLTTGKRKKVGHNDSPVFALDIHPVTDEIYVGGNKKKIFHFGKNLKEVDISFFVGHSSKIESMFYEIENRKLYSGANDGEIIVWKDGEMPERVWKKEGMYLPEAILSIPQENVLFIGGASEIVKLDLKTRDFKTLKTGIRLRSIIVHKNNVIGALGQFVQYLDKKIMSSPFSDTPHKLLSLEKKNEIIVAPFLNDWFTILDAKRLTVKNSVTIPVQNHGVYDMALSSDQTVLYVTCSDIKVRVYDTRTWDMKYEVSMKNSLYHITASHDGTYIAGTVEDVLELYTVKDFSRIARLKVNEKISEIVFMDDTTIVIGGELGMVKKVKVVTK